MNTFKRRPKQMYAYGAGGVLLAVIAIIAILISSASGADTPNADPVASIAEAFAVVNPATPAAVEELPTEVQQILSPGRPGDPSTIEAVGRITTANQVPVTVAVTGGNVCLVSEGKESKGGACGDAQEALAGEVYVAGFCGPGLPEGSARVLGLVPDGIESVNFQSESGGEAVPVVDGVYEATVPAVPTTIEAVGSTGGKLAVPLPLAADAKAIGPCTGSPNR